jgi:uncharacterized damage-inducible protein DinB
MIMEPLRTYDYLTLARQRVFEWIRPLSSEQYSREFPVGLGTLGKTLTHIITSEWYYVQRLQGSEVPPYDQWPIHPVHPGDEGPRRPSARKENPPPFATLEATWIEQARHTRDALSAVRDWNQELEYQVTDDDNWSAIVTTSRGDIFTQLALHEVHHRAQAMGMLRQLGVALDDIDFNTLMYKLRSVSP